MFGKFWLCALFMMPINLLAGETPLTENQRRVEYQIQLDLERLQALSENFNPAQFSFFERLINDPIHPLAVVALQVLAKNPHYPENLNLIRATINNPRPQLQNTALATLVFLRDRDAESAVRKLLNAPDATVKMTAILACGELQLTNAAPTLQTIMQTAQPQIGIYAAGALLKLKCEVDAARDFLEQAGRLPRDPQLATTALRFLGLLDDRAAISYFFERLSSEWEQVAVAAAQNLNRLPAATVARGLSAYPYERAQLLRARWEIINFLGAITTKSSSAEFPAAAAEILFTRGNAIDTRRGLASWRGAPAIRNLPLLIELLVARRDFADSALQILVEFIATTPQQLSAPPPQVQAFTAWVQWWFRHYRLLAIDAEQALVKLPDGSTQVVQLYDALTFGATVKKIAAGSGERNLQGAQVELAFGTELYLILP